MKYKCKKIAFFLGICVSMIISGCRKEQGEMFLAARDGDSKEVLQELAEISENDLALTEQNNTIFVFICGEVLNPGVYEVPAGTRIYEVVNLAGGLTEKADMDYLNQVELVEDGQKIKVPILQINAMGESDSKATQADGLVNINTAQEESLMTLNGVGSSRAKDIISYRENNGGFKSVEEIKNVPGIKDGLYNKIKDRITVD